MSGLTTSKSNLKRTEDNAVLDWQNATLPNSYPPTENMMVRIKNYDVPCHRLCCLSEDCAAIKCDGCRCTLTTFPPLDRYECIECPPWLGREIHDNYDKLAEMLFIRLKVTGQLFW